VGSIVRSNDVAVGPSSRVKGMLKRLTGNADHCSESSYHPTERRGRVIEKRFCSSPDLQRVLKPGTRMGVNKRPETRGGGRLLQRGGMKYSQKATPEELWKWE